MRESRQNTSGPIKELRTILIVNTVVGLGISALSIGFSGSLNGWWMSLLGNQIYAHVIGTLASLTIPHLAMRLPTGRPWVQWPLYVTALVIIGFTGAVIATSAAAAVGLFPWHVAPRVFRTSSRIAVMITVLMGVSTYVIEMLQHRLRRTTLDLRTEQLQREHASKLAAEAQLTSLQSRLQPHFLFNTINSIQALMAEDPKRAEQMLQRLSHLLRYSLDSQQRTLVPLAEEMRLLTDYLEIERERFGDRLRFSIDIPASLASVAVPPYALQTLVENSMKYAVAPRRQGGEIRISARQENGCLRLEVQDDGPGFSRDAISEGHGLHTLESRLVSLFGTKGSLGVNSENGARVEVRVPA